MYPKAEGGGWLPGGGIVVGGRVYWAPKNDLTTWEDGCALSFMRRRFAVADGASAGYESREWALQLVRGFIASDGPPEGAGKKDIAVWLESQARVFTSRPRPSAGDDEWMFAAAEEGGSFATFIGLQLHFSAPGSLRWEAFVIGDCCLFHLSDGQRVKSFPCTSPDQFDDYPDLVPSSPARLRDIEGRIKTTGGNARIGDSFILGSDAISQWLLRNDPEDTGKWRRLFSLRERDASFQDLVRRERAAGRLRDDDVTLALLTVAVCPEEPEAPTTSPYPPTGSGTPR